MSDPEASSSLSERLNKYVGLIRAENPNMAERKKFLDQASKLALTEQKKTFLKQRWVWLSLMPVADRFGDGTLN